MRFAAPLALLLASVAAVPAQAQSAELVSPVLLSDDARDPWSFAQPEVARVTHVALDLALDFEAKSVGGTATLDIAARPDADTVVLDSEGLQIARITDDAGRALPFTVGQEVEGKGAPVTVSIGKARRIVVTYAAAPEAEALQWLTPEQTAGGKFPYLLSQGQAILNRSWVPTQDSPGIRQTWEARIVAPKPLTVVMSGLKVGEPEDLGGTRAFRFSMDKPVAPYLIAIAAGDIAFRELGPRTGVWTEPSMLDAAAAELADTEKMVEAAEALYGPYRWGRYDMIVLPPSFPYGGMENPVMTFLTPTFIAGDRSLTGLVAHELAHSWSGNLVTNANWSDSWLNEGVTSYFENRIVEALYGSRRASQEAALSFAEIETVLAEKGADSPVTALHLPKGTDGPDDSESGIVYDKGAVFLRTVEKAVGRERFDAWLRQWFDSHAFQPATSAMIVADMREHLIAGDAQLEEQLMLDQWVYAPGLPSNVARPAASAFAEVDGAAAHYPSSHFIDPEAWAGWTTAERQRLLAKLPRKLSHDELDRLDRDLGLSHSGNSEVLFAWLELALANRYDPAVPVAEKFLSQVGRRKFVLPLFEALWGQGEWGQPIAKRIYAETRAGYHSVTQGSVDKLVTSGG
ncbi:leukotriene A4 hydrolase C-terminal domain-containing protein [Croceibacterium sp. LX-88]|uniref:Aminopeptidase N n=1 Tax=Croceibacterium selenioxidans TaxID=2838833 RepID=A0ABS5W8F1_9SPHN|nr:M1 family metallopeptidase [Croceibacterium selenioxidans]MBT2135796.1 leukotriene A4 hydrolase C-terminal domain-containing protein [Croceibacterium selenioxidans]